MVQHAAEQYIPQTPRDRQHDIAQLHFLIMMMRSNERKGGFFDLDMQIVNSVLMADNIDQITYTLSMKDDGRFDFTVAYRQKGATETTA